jgi:hypothetical protein
MASAFDRFDFQHEQFIWPVWEAGYIWSSEVRDKQGYERPPFLIAEPAESEWRWTYPLQNKRSIFKDLVLVSMTSPEEIQQFANKHGNLSKGALLIPHSKVLQRFPYGVSLETWQHEIAAVSWADKILEMVNASVLGNVSEAQRDLKGVVAWDRKNNLVEVTMPFGIRRLRVDRYPELATASARNLRLPALIAMRDYINDKLIEHRVVPRLLYDPEGQNLAPRLTPEFLVGAIWFQLYQCAIGEIRYKRCPECGDWEDVGPDSSHRSDWRMHPGCANKRRQREYYQRVKGAQ